MTQRSGPRLVLGTAADGLAGVAAVNAVPHLRVGLAGRRMLTPIGGPDSSPGQNLAWGAINAAAAAGLLVLARHADPARRARGRIPAVLAGAAVMTGFAVTYTIVTARRET